MLEAKDLPQNNLSMLLEQRVNRKLEEDRQARAAQQVRGRAVLVVFEVDM
jgi:G:T-mismatch repair DNA endonuclease (very short patch repair protein)